LIWRRVVWKRKKGMAMRGPGGLRVGEVYRWARSRDGAGVMVEV
jgi:hypothetical protein